MFQLLVMSGVERVPTLSISVAMLNDFSISKGFMYGEVPAYRFSKVAPKSSSHLAVVFRVERLTVAAKG